MSILYPDNDNRHARLVQLAADTKESLDDCKVSSDKVKTSLSRISSLVSRICTSNSIPQIGIEEVPLAGIPTVSQAGTAMDNAVCVSKLVLDVGATAASFAWLAPGVTAALVSTGAISAEIAAATLFSVCGMEIAAGALVGGFLAGLIVAVVIVGIGFVIDAIEGVVLRDKLRKGIHDFVRLRLELKVYSQRSALLAQTLESAADALETLSISQGLTYAVVQSAVGKVIQPGFAASEAYSVDQANIDLSGLDKSRNSWSQEDDTARNEPSIPDPPAFYVSHLSAPSSFPLPPGTKLVALVRDGEDLDLSDLYPVLEYKCCRVVALSYTDNRESMLLAAFKKNLLCHQWSKDGARYVSDIYSDALNGQIIFVGQAEKKIQIPWSDLKILN